MRGRLSELHLKLIAGVIALTILAVSGHALWADRQNTWREAEIASKNILSALSREIGNDIALLDLALKGVVEGLRYRTFNDLPAEVQHRMLFDRATSARFVGTIMLLDENGNLLADGGSIIAPRPMNFSDRNFFAAHKDHSFLGSYLGRPYRSSLGSGETSIALSRRLSHPDGKFIGVVAAEISLKDTYNAFRNFNLGPGGSISFFRNDGVLLMRQPFDEANLGKDLSKTPNVQRFIQEPSGTFVGRAAIDGVQRLYTFSHIDSLPLILSVSLSTDDILAAWNRKALVQSLVTSGLCFAVVGLTVLSQREIRRRTRAETKLRRIARTDDLTGLPNRRAFREAFEREWRQATRTGSTLSLLYIDVDSFKSFNDRYGHGKGDEVLRAIGRGLETNLRRPRDMAARHGGEEFVVVLPETEAAGARTVAENIRHTIIDLGIAHEGSPHGVVTVSIGAASARPLRGNDAGSLLKSADEALYEAKASGRNRAELSKMQHDALV